MGIINKLRLLGITFLLFSCGGGSNNDSNSDENSEDKVYYGGVFETSLTSYYNNKQINQIKKLETTQVYFQIFEGLVKYNPKTLEIEPALAESWSVSEDGLNYSFLLRENVYFHDNDCFEGGKGRLVTPEDVIYSFQTVYDSSLTNVAYNVFKNTIVGGDEFHSGEVDEIEGITTEGNEISFKLSSPNLSFIERLANVFGSIVAHEAIEAAEFVPVGTGPFVFDKNNSNTEIVKLGKNNNYYGLDEAGNQLPYLDSVVFVYYEDKDVQMEHFWKEELSYIGSVPITKISEVLEDRIGDFESKPPKYILSSKPELVTTYLELNMLTPVLQNKKVRQALNYAINRKKLVEKIMKNQAYEIGKFGITPPLTNVFDTYDFEGIEDVSYTYNPVKAKELLAEAGYPNGKNFPSLEMQFSAGSTDYLIASEIQSQLRHVLNVNIDIEAIEFNQLLENTAMGSSDIFRTNWVGEYTSPQAFLANAYGKNVPEDANEPSFLNSSRYQNEEFDNHFENGSSATDKNKASEHFGNAEKILMEDAPFIILWYGEDLTLMQARLENFYTNSIGYIDLKKAFFKLPITQEETSN